MLEAEEHCGLFHGAAVAQQLPGSFLTLLDEPGFRRLAHLCRKISLQTPDRHTAQLCKMCNRPCGLLRHFPPVLNGNQSSIHSATGSSNLTARDSSRNPARTHVPFAARTRRKMLLAPRSNNSPSVPISP